MMFNVLKHYHVMVAIPYMELHQGIFPPVPAPVPTVPHLAGAALCLGPWGALTGKPNPTEHSASGGKVMSQGTDIGPLIPHYNLTPPAPPNSLLPIMLLTSGSKSHFGAHKTQAPKGPVAFAVAVKINFNLNCAGPIAPPLPSGVVVTFNTHTTGATIGDIVAGALHLVIDLAIQFGLNRLFAWSKVSNFFEDIAQRALGPGMRALGYGNIQAMVEYGIPGLGRFGRNVGSMAEEFLFNLPGTLAAWGVGSPLGYSGGQTQDRSSPTPVGGKVGDALDSGHGSVQQAVDDYFNSPGPGDYPVPGQGGVPDDGTRSV
jgi:hypothetical protein